MLPRDVHTVLSQQGGQPCIRVLVRGLVIIRLDDAAHPDSTLSLVINAHGSATSLHAPPSAELI